MTAGLLMAARRRTPSWAVPGATPQKGRFCSCFDASRWWREAEKPKGWHCGKCHLPPSLAGVAKVLA